jgi:hypothetical protein
MVLYQIKGSEDDRSLFSDVNDEKTPQELEREEMGSLEDEESLRASRPYSNSFNGVSINKAVKRNYLKQLNVSFYTQVYDCLRKCPLTRR